MPLFLASFKIGEIFLTQKEWDGFVDKSYEHRDVLSHLFNCSKRTS